LCSFICERLHSRGELPAEGFVVKTGVTTDLICAIARDYGLRCVGDLLVGFKWIAKEIARDPDAFIFGGEESHGFVRGAFVRDKDSAIAALHLAECAATLKARGRTLFDGLEALHGRYGVHSERLSSIAREGARGQAQIQRLMESLRAEPPPAIGRHRIVEMIDRSDGTVRDPATGAIRRTLRGARGDMLVFLLSHDGKTRLTVRPSGTEPKVKVYAAAYNPPSAEPDRGSVGAKARRMVEDFHAFAESRMR
jgi:phosphoglucomutase/phosphomannomutase